VSATSFFEREPGGPIVSRRTRRPENNAPPKECGSSTSISIERGVGGGDQKSGLTHRNWRSTPATLSSILPIIMPLMDILLLTASARGKEVRGAADGSREEYLEVKSGFERALAVILISQRKFRLFHELLPNLSTAQDRLVWTICADYDIQMDALIKSFERQMIVRAFLRMIPRKESYGEVSPRFRPFNCPAAPARAAVISFGKEIRACPPRSFQIAPAPASSEKPLQLPGPVRPPLAYRRMPQQPHR